MSIVISFILGILSGLLMAAMVLGVLAFVKVNKLIKTSELEFDLQRRSLNEEISMIENQIQERFNEISDSINSKYDDVHREFDDVHREFDNVYREMDSRLDKLDNKLSTRFKEVKQIIND